MTMKTPLYCLSVFTALALAFHPVSTALADAVPESAIEGAKYETVSYKKTTDANGEPVELNLWVFKPEGWKAEIRRPAIVFFFGGGWRNGSPKQFVPHCEYLAERGMVAITAEYRIKNTHGTSPLEATKDARSAVRWIRAHAAELGIDPDRIAAGGGSAGGHLAAATATIPDVNEAGEDTGLSAEPNALVLFNPAVDLDRPELKEKLGEETYLLMKGISPLQHVTAALPPTIIFHGEADPTVPFSTVEAFTAKGKELGADVTLKGYPDRVHGFFNFGRGDGKDYETTVAEMDEFLTGLGWLKAKSS